MTRLWSWDYLAVRRLSWRIYALSIVVSVGAALRWFSLGSHSLWVDETYSVVVRGGESVGEVLGAVDPHPPLYYLLLNGWMWAFGNSATAARSLSVLSGVVTLVVVYALGRELFDGYAGVLAATLLAVSPIHVQYSRSARMYALLVLLACLSTYAYVRIHNSRGDVRWLAGYAVVTLGLLYTHTFAAFAVAAHGLHLFYLWLTRREQVPAPQRWLGVGAVVGVAYLPWVGQALAYVGSESAGLTEWITEPSPRAVVRTFEAFGGSLTNYPYALFDPVSRTAGQAALVLILVGAFLYLFAGNENEKPRHPGTGELLGAWILAPVAGPLVVSYLVTPLYVTRYTIAAVVPLYLVAAFGIRSIRNTGGRMVVFAILVLCLLVSAGVYHSADTQEPWAAVDDYLDGRVDTGETVYVTPDWAAPSLRYYADRPVVGAGLTPGSGPGFSASVAGDPTSTSPHWVVLREPASTLRDELLEDYVVTDRREFGVLRVLRVEREGESQ